MKRLTYGQLPRNPTLGVVLFCDNCFATYSARRGDYFWREPRDVPMCGSCGDYLSLVIKRLDVLSITPEKAEAMS